MLSTVGKEILRSHGFRFRTADFTLLERTRKRVPIWQHKRGPFFAVNARVDPWTRKAARLYPRDPTLRPIGEGEPTTAGGRDRRDLRMLSDAVEVLLNEARELGYRHVHSALLASGPLRTFPRSASLMEMVRGWSRWRAEASGSIPRLSIHVVAPDVLHDLGSGRLDIAGCLNPDDFEFWLKIVQASGEEERYLCAEQATTSVRKLLDRFGLTDDHWGIDLFPTPASKWANWTVARLSSWEAFSKEKMTLERFGIRQGTTLRARRST